MFPDPISTSEYSPCPSLVYHPRGAVAKHHAVSTKVVSMISRVQYYFTMFVPFERNLPIASSSLPLLEGSLDISLSKQGVTKE